jgi:hypothetical protein
LTQPSIKGSAITATVEDVQKLVQKGVISEKELEQRLTGGALALVRQPIVVSSWYDMRAVASLVELLWDVEGHGDPAYMRRRGEEIGERLLQGGLYAQLEFVKRKKLDPHTDGKARFEAFGRDLRLVTTISGSMYNFGRWSVRPDPERAGRYLIEVHEATAVPVPTSLATEGFMNHLMKEMRELARWQMERPRPDLVVYIMDQPLCVREQADSSADASGITTSQEELRPAVRDTGVPSPREGKRAEDTAASPEVPRDAIKGSAISEQSATENSVKGSILMVTLEELRTAVRSGQLSEGEVRRALGPETAELALRKEIQLASWYPVRLYDPILRYMMNALGGGKTEYLVECGRKTARELVKKGVYQQLKSANFRADPAFVRLVISLSKGIYNFTRWELAAFDENKQWFEIVISGAEDYPDTFMWRNVGFVEVSVSEHAGVPWTVRCSRPTRDRVVLRVTRST